MTDLADFFQVLKLSAAEVQQGVNNIHARMNADGLIVGAHDRGTTRSGPRRTQTSRPTVASNFTASHLVLLHAGHMPKVGDQASHLCHERSCCVLGHLLWEPAPNNIKRNKCKKKQGECVCTQHPSCVFEHTNWKLQIAKFTVQKFHLFFHKHIIIIIKHPQLTRCWLALIRISSLWHSEHWAEITNSKKIDDSFCLLCFKYTVGFPMIETVNY
jgi:hypothetical protein